MAVVKWLAGAVVGLLFMLALAVILIPLLVDPNDYRDDISVLVKEQTGRDLRLSGDLKISVFPWLGIQTEGLALSQPSQIGGDMVSMDSAQLRLKLIPLLSKQLEIDTIVLERPALNLITLQDGISSFDGLGGDDANQPSATAGTSQPQTSIPQSEQRSSTEASRVGQDVANNTAVALVIQGIEITDARVVWDDRAAGQKYEVSDFNLTTGNLLGGDLAPVALSGAVIDSANPTPIRLRMDAMARLNRDTLVTDLEDLESVISQGEQSLALSLDSLRFEQNQQIIATGLNLKTEAELASEDPSQAPQALSLNSTIEQLAYQFSGPMSLTTLELQGRFADRDFIARLPMLNADLEKQNLGAESVSVESGDLKLAVSNLVVSQLVDAPKVSARLALTPFNARALLSDLEIEYVPSGANALKSVGLDADITASTGAASLRNLRLKLDETLLQGNLGVSDFDQLAAEFDLALDTLNLDHYLPVSSEEDTPAVESGDALAVPLAALKVLNANGTFRADSLISGGLKLEDIDVRVESRDGQLTVTPKAKLYDGSLEGNIAFRESGDSAALTVKNEIDLVSLGNMLTDADITDQLSGLGSLLVDVVVSEQGGVQRNEGVIKLVAKNGAIKGVDIKKMIESAYATYERFTGGDSQEPASEGQQLSSQAVDETRFAELLGTFYLKDNVLTNNDFSLKAPLFRVNGEGDIDLAAQTLNYLVKVAVVGSTDGQGGKALKELSGITIPIRLRGDLSAPGYTLDMKSLYQSYAKRELDKKKGELVQRELGIEGGENLSTKDILKGALLNRLNRDKKEKESEQSESQQTSEPVPYEETGQVEAQSDEGAESNSEETAREPTKKELREERKRKLIESIFK